jgi:hypothetical protein
MCGADLHVRAGASYDAHGRPDIELGLQDDELTCDRGKPGGRFLA